MPDQHSLQLLHPEMSQPTPVLHTNHSGRRVRHKPAPAAGGPAVGQQRLLDLAARGDVLDTCLYTAPGRYGGGGAGTTWLVGSPDDVTTAQRRYAELDIRHFVLSDTPYKRETARVGAMLHSGQW